MGIEGGFWFWVVLASFWFSISIFFVKRFLAGGGGGVCLCVLSAHTALTEPHTARSPGRCYVISRSAAQSRHHGM